MIDPIKLLKALDIETLETLRDSTAQAHKEIFEELERRKNINVTP